MIAKPDDSYVESLEGVLKLEQSIRLEYFKDKVIAEKTEKSLSMLNNLIIDKFKVVPDHLKKTLSKINNFETFIEIAGSIHKFDDIQSLNSFIKCKIYS